MPTTITDGMTIANLPLRLRLGRQQQERIITQTREALAESRERKLRLHSRLGAEAYRDRAREKLNLCFLRNTAPHTVTGTVTGTLVRTGYRVEKVVIETMPGWFVSGSLYIPDGATAETPAPCVLGLCGHTDNGKASDSYQRFSQGLAKLGYVCLTIDCIGQGERRQVPASAVNEHRMLGGQLPLVGESLAGMQAEDAMRCLDYLLARPEVNATHVGVTGNSGGGTQAAWVTALDPRVTMSAPSCFVTSLLSNLENELWGDHEQTPPRCLELGLDMDDMLAAFAPRKLCLIGQARDYNDSRGLADVHRRLSRVYELLGAPGNLRLYIGPNAHGFSVDGRQQMYQWFNRAVTGVDAPVVEPATSLETEQDLWATATGSVNDLAEAKSTTVYLRERADAAALVRGAPTGPELEQRVRDLLRLPAERDPAPPHYRVWPHYFNWTNTGTSLSPAPTPPNWPQPYGAVYAVETEPGILAPLYRVSTGYEYHHAIVEKPAGTRAILYVAHDSADRELCVQTREPALSALIAAEPTAAIFALDPRGVGESKPHTSVSYTENFHAQHLEMLGGSVLGRQVWDLLRCLDLMAAHGYDDVHILGRGLGSVAAALAALLHPAVKRVTLKNGLTRWHACARAEPDQMAWSHGLLPTGALLSFDLPDVYAALAPKSFVNVAPWGAWFANPAGEF